MFFLCNSRFSRTFLAHSKCEINSIPSHAMSPAKIADYWRAKEGDLMVSMRRACNCVSMIHRRAL